MNSKIQKTKRKDSCEPSISNRGQSEVLGVVLLLSLTMMGIGMISVFAEPSVSDGLDRVGWSQMENEFSLLDSRLSTSALGASDSQGVELSLDSGLLQADPDGATMRLYQNFTNTSVQQVNSTVGPSGINNALQGGTGPYDSGPCIGEDVTTSATCDITDESGREEIAETLNTTLMKIEIGNIEYIKGDRKLAYEGGGVWKKNEETNQSIMMSPPEFHYSPRGQTLTIPLFNMTNNVSVSSNRGANFEVVADSEPRQVFEQNPVVGGKIMAEVESEYYRAWANYFKSRTQGTIDEEKIDDENQTARVDLTVPFDQDLDGGHAFQGGSVDEDYFKGGVSKNEFFLSASDYIEDNVEQAEDNNNNSDVACITDNQIGSDCTSGSELHSDGGEAYYYINESGLNNYITFDITSGNVTLVVDSSLDVQGGRNFDVIPAADNSTRAEILVRGPDNTDIGGSGSDINVGGNASNIVYFIHSEIDEVNINGVSSGDNAFTLYAPNSLLTGNGMGNINWRGALVASNADLNGGNPNNPGYNKIGEGSPVNLELGGQENTITYLQVTENEVSVR
jgi:hypothetical protein